MNWKLKSTLQNALGRLPSNVANPLYYRLQRSFGNLRHPTPVSRLQAGLEMVRRLQQQGRDVESAVFLEVGTGHQLNVPLSLWLCGAAQVITVDLNRYLREQLVLEDIDYLRRHEAEIRELFVPTARRELFEERLARLLAGAGSLKEVLALTNIQYRAPADAGSLTLTPGTIDYHVSFTVLEHIPTTVLKQIFLEGCRLLRPEGLFVHCIDFSDHFAHSDETLSSVNFLQFSERQWSRLAGNRYMYHNRLRVDEFQTMIAEMELEILALDTTVDEQAANLLIRDFPLADRFETKDCRTNATAGAWLVASPTRRNPMLASGVYPPALGRSSPYP